MKKKAEIPNSAETQALNIPVVMPRFYYRILNALKLGWWAFKNKDSVRVSNFKMLSDLFVLIMKVATEHRHMMTRIAYVHPEEGEKEIVTIWAGAGMTSDPTKRISELISENAILKAQLSKYVAPVNEA